MTYRILSTTALVAALSIVPMGAAFSQEAAVRGQITQIFDGRVLLQTDDEAILVRLPEDVDGDSLKRGQRFAVEGDRSGSDMVATAMRLQSESDGAEDNASDDRDKPDTPDLPEALAGLDLRDLRSQRDDDETKYRARLDGMKFEAEYDRTGRLEEVKTERTAALPDQLVERLLSEDLRSAISDLGFGQLYEIERETDKVEVKGLDAEGRRIEAEFDPSGLLLEFERKDHDGKRKSPPMQLGDDELRDIVRDAGYTDIAKIKIKGNHADLDAINPDDEPVRLRIDAAGEIIREERR